MIRRTCFLGLLEGPKWVSNLSPVLVIVRVGPYSGGAWHCFGLRSLQPVKQGSALQLLMIYEGYMCTNQDVENGSSAAGFENSNQCLVRGIG